MPLIRGLGERVGDAGAHADQRGLLDAELGRDQIGGAEADAADVARQAIGVLRDQLDGVGTVGLVDAHRLRGANAVAVQKQPTTTEGIEKYLGSGMIRGIGPIYSKKLVHAFGEAVFDVIEQEPQRLREVTGIGPKRAERIVGAPWPSGTRL
jgi:hypothetical protein